MKCVGSPGRAEFSLRWSADYGFSLLKCDYKLGLLVHGGFCAAADTRQPLPSTVSHQTITNSCFQISRSVRNSKTNAVVSLNLRRIII
ncbi:hypothetical protein ACLOJK_038211 [Asimina triloba]